MSYSYFDLIVIAWLLVGIMIGRRHGLTQELLPTLQWLCVVILAGLFYAPIGSFIQQNTNGAFSHVWANVTAYVLIGFGINLLFMWLKQSVGEKLTGSDLFGRSEYYLGMLAALVRFACMVVVLCALMHSRVYTTAELAETEKVQKKNFEDVRFPTYGSFQHSVLTESYTGRLIVDHLPMVLIASSSAPRHAETMAQKNQDTINSILGGPKK
ncbi:MAG: CvpA family protein [Verrucomicrobiota bacterium]